MKRILLLLGLFLLTPVALTAKPTALMSNYIHDSKRYMTYKIVRGQPLNVLVQVPRFPERQSDYEAYVLRLYDRWFHSATAVIRSSNRREFDDLLPVLSQPAKIRFVSNQEKYDIKFRFVSPKEVRGEIGGHSNGAFSFSPDGAEIVVSDKIDWQRDTISSVHLHEVGHSLGLDEQYYYGEGEGRNASVDVNYASPVREKSVMNNNAPKYVKGITEDDADGLVLAVDFALGNYNRGGEKGWKSLDPKSELYYVHGKVGNSPHSFRLDGNEVHLIKYDERGNFLSARKLPFSSQGLNVLDELQVTHILLRDQQGRPIVEKGPHGQTIYTSYFYETVLKLVEKNDQVLRYEKTTFDDRDAKKPLFKEVVSASQEGFVYLRGDFYTQQVSYMVDMGIVHMITCTSHKCKDDRPRLQHESQKTRSVDLEQNVLFEKLKAWLKGKGSIKPQS